MKSCSKCKEEKSFSEFGKKSSSADGYSYQCKTCKNSYYTARDVEIKAKRKSRYKNNKDKELARSQEWVNKNRPKSREYKRKYKEQNRDKVNAAHAKRRTSKIMQTPEVSNQEKIGIDGLYFIAQVLSNSCSEQYHVDHVHPISKGGLHNLDNLQVIPAIENLRKGDKIVCT